MTDPRSVRRALIIGGVAVLAAVPAFLLGSGSQQTDASWVIPKSAAVTATAVTPTPPAAVTCQASGLLNGNVAFSWTAPAGPAPSGYTLRWTGAATGSTTSTTTSANVPPPIGTITVSVFSDYGNWESGAATQTRQISGIAFVGWTCG